MEDEQPLAGGNAAGPVVRVGDTVRKAWTASTPSVSSYVDFLRSAGVDTPRPLGRDAQGRQVQEFVPGPLAMDAQALSRAQLRRVGGMVRAIHDASAAFVPAVDACWHSPIPAPDAELVCHNDLAPWNLIRGDRWVFIDWDAAAPSTRLWDLAYAAQTFTLGDVGRDPADAAQDLACFVTGYRADARLRTALPSAMARRVDAMVHLLRSSEVSGVEPWASMSADGHGEHWEAVGRYVTAHERVWREALTAGA
ncbi:phosphotransferase [Microbacterium gorillae]|uniref:phosphotransferase n=1 Tax=Microbacterium gorillae TaxID=1231063 RepID=UPI00058B5202|nr:phosphotransferase [Microbacterium gorillae]